MSDVGSRAPLKRTHQSPKTTGGSSSATYTCKPLLLLSRTVTSAPKAFACTRFAHSADAVLQTPCYSSSFARSQRAHTRRERGREKADHLLLPLLSPSKVGRSLRIFSGKYLRSSRPLLSRIAFIHRFTCCTSTQCTTVISIV
jgi:hypothetical protein